MSEETTTEILSKPTKTIDGLIEALGLEPDEFTSRPLISVAPGIESTGDSNLAFFDRDMSVSDEDRFMNTLASLFVNVDLDAIAEESVGNVLSKIDGIMIGLDEMIQQGIQTVVKSESFRDLERNWRSLDTLEQEIDNENDKHEAQIDFIDATKEDIGQDLEDHDSDILTSALFKRVYVEEYDRFGGQPFGAMLGLYEFEHDRENIDWLRTMGKIARAAHCPFISSVNSKFFGCENYDELDKIRDLEERLTLPKFNDWNRLRESDEAAYLGLSVPRYMMRAPWDVVGPRGHEWKFNEGIDDPGDFLWGSSAVLFAKNMIRSFEESGWCQHICGPRSGGKLNNLPLHTYEVNERSETQPPVEMAIPDYRELQFAKNGFIPLIHEKNEGSATFFSARSIRRATEFQDEIDTQNDDLVCNLAYTLSITRIAHYAKRMVRDYIGSAADAPYIQSMLEKWLMDYVTTVVNPDDLTLRSYPFKAVSVEVSPKPGPLGWYEAIISILPHAKFEGMDVELRLEAALGG